MALSVGLLLLVVLGIGQLVLPAIAAQIVRSRLGKHGKVISVQVSAFPAVELLWGHVGRLDVRMADYDAAPEQASDELRQAGSVGTLNIAIKRLHTGLLTLHDVGVSKRGAELTVGAQLDTSNLQSALPIIQSVTPVSSSGGELTLRGTVNVFGARVSANAVVAASDGKIVVAPQGLLGSFATVTVFDDPGIYVQGVSGRTVPGGLFVAVRARFT